MNYANIQNHIFVAVCIGFIGILSINNAAASVVIDPKGHDPVALQQDQMECRDLAASVEFDIAKEHQGRAVARGAAVGIGAAAIAGGNKEMRRRSAAGGAMVGGLARNKGKRVDNSVESIKQKDAERSCLIGRGYNPIS